MFQDDFFIITIPFLEGAIAPKCQFKFPTPNVKQPFINAMHIQIF